MAKVSVSLAKGENTMDELRRVEDGGFRTHDDPRQRKRQAPMEVLVLGVSRTGTMCEAPLLLEAPSSS